MPFTLNVDQENHFSFTLNANECQMNNLVTKIYLIERPTKKK